MLNLLNDVDISFIAQITDISLNWIAKLVGILIGAVGSVGLGIILFTLILKTVVLPFDIYQRINMRKQNLKMEQMRPELEKLQHDYANDRNMYSQKMMEVYKKNNYSMFGACLPMILMMVILIVAFNALNAYSQFANLHCYGNMVNAYNEKIITYSIDDPALNDVVTNGVAGKDYVMTTENGGYVVYKVEDEQHFIYYKMNSSGVKEYMIDTARANAYLSANHKAENYDGKSYDDVLASYVEKEEAKDKDNAVRNYLENIASSAAAEVFRDNRVSFYWVKNIWYADTAWNHPIGSYADFTGKITKKIEIVNANGDKSKVSVSSVISEGDYLKITANLQTEKSQPNGYFVLCILSVGLMFLSQFIAMKSSKAQNELGSVNGQGAQSQKMMMVIFPLMFGIFAFSYSGAFSIYMVISSAYSIVTMLVSQYFVDIAFRKQEEKDLQAKYNRVTLTRNSNKKN